MADAVSVGDHAKVEFTFIEDIRATADKLAKDNMPILIESINHGGKPGYFVSRLEPRRRADGEIGETRRLASDHVARQHPW
jgi:hydroxypyruvate isomerase